MNGLALCAGVGMLDEGLRAGCEFLGVPYRTVCYIEREAFAAAQLVARMEDGVLDKAPIWSDLTTFNGAAWRGKLDCLTAGFPCQPHSIAGKRAGLNDERWIWPDIVNIIRATGVWVVWLENVPGLISTGGLASCLADLSALGFDAQWGVLAAGAVGASHKRERLFILAYSRLQHEQLQQWKIRPEHQAGSTAVVDPISLDRGAISVSGRYRKPRENPERKATDRTAIRSSSLGNANGQRQQQPDNEGSPITWKRPRNGAGGTGGILANTCSIRLHARRHSNGKHDGAVINTNGQLMEPTEQIESISRGIFAPGPSDNRWQSIITNHPYLAPATESGFCVMADGLAVVVDESRADQLRAIGNGVVALQAATAFVLLARRAGIIGGK